jgi:hypothetical protein
MDDKKWLEELRAQRELLQKHLEWLDAKIAEQEEEGSGKVATGAPGPVVARNPEGGGHNHTPSSDEATKAEPLITTEIEESIPALSDEDDPYGKYHIYKPPTGDDVLRAKIGCLALFVLSTTLFLFLLFGLPYLLD